MNFVTAEFAVFFLIVLTFWWTTERIPKARQVLLLGANLIFYAASGVAFVPLLLGLGFVNWAFAGAMDEAKVPGRRKLWLICGLFVNLATLAFFKYYEFFVVEFATLFGMAGLVVPLDFLLPPALMDMVFPIGISFYVFQGIAFLVDRHRGDETTRQPLHKVILFLSFFPTVLSGPILRPRQFFPQLESLTSGSGRPVDSAGQPMDSRAVQEGFALILSGLFKKVVLASYLSDHVVHNAFQGPEGYSSWGMMLAVYGYSMQIYCDFSGYTDLALGFARLLGFKLPQNFDAPYLTYNLQDFWRRWHMTLSSWLRDYLYIPLGGSRTGHTYRNLFLTMFLGGLWHGAHTRFLVWGCMHGVGLCVVHALQGLKKKRNNGVLPTPSRPGKFFGWLLTFHFATIAWVFFGTENMDRALEVIRRVFVWGQPGEGGPLMAVPVIICAMLTQVFGRHIMRWFIDFQERLPLVARAAVTAVVCVIILRMGPEGVLPFIYFQF